MEVAKKGKVYAKPIDGTWYTTGDPLNYLKATIAFGLKHPKVGKDFGEYLRSLHN
jgi:UTP--glucose-1-phosphate uridylyltransferase